MGAQLNVRECAHYFVIILYLVRFLARRRIGVSSALVGGASVRNKARLV